MQVTVNIPDNVAAQAQTRGVAIEAYIEGLIERATAHVSVPDATTKSFAPVTGFHKRTSAEAVAHIRESRKGITLGGLKIRDLINEGRR